MTLKLTPRKVLLTLLLVAGACRSTSTPDVSGVMAADGPVEAGDTGNTQLAQALDAALDSLAASGDPAGDSTAFADQSSSPDATSLALTDSSFDDPVNFVPPTAPGDGSAAAPSVAPSAAPAADSGPVAAPVAAPVASSAPAPAADAASAPASPAAPAASGTPDLATLLPALATYLASGDLIGQATVAGLLDDDTIQSYKTALDSSSASSDLQDKLASVDAARKQLRSSYALATAVSADPQQAPCVVEGGLLSGGQCQCRAWGRFVDKYTFPATLGGLIVQGAPRSTVVSGLQQGGVLTPGRVRRCPNLEMLYCHGWTTTSGGCGIFQKGADWKTHALVASAKLGESACWSTYDQLIQRNIGTLRSQCDAHYALLNTTSRTIQIWQYDATGRVKTQEDIAHQPGQSVVSALSSLSTQQIATLCNQTRSPRQAASWVASPAGCRCGSRVMDLNEIDNFATVATFQRQCLSTMQ